MIFITAINSLYINIYINIYIYINTTNYNNDRKKCINNNCIEYELYMSVDILISTVSNIRKLTFLFINIKLNWHVG